MASEKQLVDLDFNGDSRATNLLDPSAAQDAATKAYVDARVSGLDWKPSVRVATTAALTFATDFENGDTVDGVVLVTGDRILIKDQAAGATNGIYTVNASGAPTRATDADSSSEVTGGMAVWINEGTANGDTGWVLTTNDPIVLGTTALVFTQFTGTGSIVAGAGLTKTGNVLDVGQGTGIQVNADDVAINTGLVARYKLFTIGNGSATSFVVNHALNQQFVGVWVMEAAAGLKQVAGFQAVHTDANNVTIDFNTAPTTNQYKVLVVG